MPSGLLQSFTPWVVYFILAGSVSSETAAITAFVATLLFSLKNLRKRYLLDWSTLIYFALLAGLSFTPLRAWLSQYAFLLSNAMLALIMWVSVIIKHPFTQQYAKEEVAERLWIIPTFKHINYTLSIVWALALSLMTLDSLLQSLNVLQSNIIADAIVAILLLSAIGFTRWFPDWYQGYLFRKLSRHKEDIAANPFLQGNFAPIRIEVNASNLPIIGALPNDLCGIYLRNGPNPAFDPISYTYPFDGDGMLHAIYLQNGKASYRNRFIETQGLVAERKAGRALYSGIARPIPTDPKLVGKNGDPGPVKNGAFIHVIRHAEHYVALYEAGVAYEVSAQLQTVGQWCPPNAKAPFNVNAHTRFDAKTQELYAFTYDFDVPYLRYYVLDKTGALTQDIAIEKPHSSMLHDFVLTENYIIFFDCPAVLDLNALAKGNNLLCWKPELGVKIAVVNRKTQKIMWIETEPFFVFHFANAFEKEDKIIVDYVRHVDLRLKEEISTGAGVPPLLYRSVLDLNTKTVKHMQLYDEGVEFPRIHENFHGTANRYIYLPAKTTRMACDPFNRLIKYDLEKQQATIHDFGVNAEIGEAVFIPATAARQEDEGYVGLFVYDKAENSSEFVLLAAQDFNHEPLAKIKLPQRVPHGLHGSWLAGLW